MTKTAIVKEQFTLLMTEKEIRARDESLARIARYEKKLRDAPIHNNGPDSCRRSHVKTHIALKYPTDLNGLTIDEYMNFKLECLGASLNALILDSWPVVLAWMKEMEIYPEEFERLSAIWFDADTLMYFKPKTRRFL